MKPRQLTPGDVLQLTPHQPDKRFAACLMVVTERREWGALGYVVGPDSGVSAVYPIRAPWPLIEYVGRAAWTRGGEEA